MLKWMCKKYKIKISAATDIGTVRESNQDNLYLMEKIRENKKLDHFICTKNQPLPILFAVCDGMGGGICGEKASYMAVDILRETDLKVLSCLDDGELEDYFLRKIQVMNDSVFSALGSSGNLSGTTATIFYADKSRIRVFNIGDSPCMEINETAIKVITCPDNQANQLYKMGKITESERWNHKTKNQLTQYLGMDPKEVKLSPHIFKSEYPQKDTIFVISTDGLTDGVSFEQIKQTVLQDQLKNPAKVLINQAKTGGSRDNITAIVIRLEVL